MSPIEEEQSALKSNSRIIKWLEMLNKYTTYKSSSKLKSRTRKGIPDDIRGQMWQLFANIETFKQSNSNLFSDYVKNIFVTKEIEINSDDESVIIRDLHRTFPTHYIFRNKLGEGQRALFRVLSAYAVYNTNTGYVQGMGFITALFLTYIHKRAHTAAGSIVKERINYISAKQICCIVSHRVTEKLCEHKTHYEK